MVVSEYQVPPSNISSVRYVYTPDLAASGERFDAIISISSVEHDGMGRWVPRAPAIARVSQGCLRACSVWAAGRAAAMLRRCAEKGGSLPLITWLWDTCTGVRRGRGGCACVPRAACLSVVVRIRKMFVPSRCRAVLRTVMFPSWRTSCPCHAPPRRPPCVAVYCPPWYDTLLVMWSRRQVWGPA